MAESIDPVDAPISNDMSAGLTPGTGRGSIDPIDYYGQSFNYDEWVKQKTKEYTDAETQKLQILEETQKKKDAIDAAAAAAKVVEVQKAAAEKLKEYDKANADIDILIKTKINNQMSTSEYKTWVKANTYSGDGDWGEWYSNRGRYQATGGDGTTPENQIDTYNVGLRLPKIVFDQAKLKLQSARSDEDLKIAVEEYNAAKSAYESAASIDISKIQNFANNLAAMSQSALQPGGTWNVQPTLNSDGTWNVPLTWNEKQIQGAENLKSMGYNLVTDGDTTQWVAGAGKDAKGNPISGISPTTGKVVYGMIDPLDPKHFIEQGTVFAGSGVDLPKILTGDNSETILAKIKALADQKTTSLVGYDNNAINDKITDYTTKLVERKNLETATAVENIRNYGAGSPIWAQNALNDLQKSNQKFFEDTSDIISKTPVVKKSMLKNPDTGVEMKSTSSKDGSDIYETGYGNIIEVKKDINGGNSTFADLNKYNLAKSITYNPFGGNDLGNNGKAIYDKQILDAQAYLSGLTGIKSSISDNVNRFTGSNLFTTDKETKELKLPESKEFMTTSDGSKLNIYKTKMGEVTVSDTGKISTPEEILKLQQQKDKTGEWGVFGKFYDPKLSNIYSEEAKNKLAGISNYKGETSIYDQVKNLESQRIFGSGDKAIAVVGTTRGLNDTDLKIGLPIIEKGGIAYVVPKSGPLVLFSDYEGLSGDEKSVYFRTPVENIALQNSISVEDLNPNTKAIISSMAENTGSYVDPTTGKFGVIGLDNLDKVVGLYNEKQNIPFFSAQGKFYSAIPYSENPSIEKPLSIFGSDFNLAQYKDENNNKFLLDKDGNQIVGNNLLGNYKIGSIGTKDENGNNIITNYINYNGKDYPELSDQNNLISITNPILSLSKENPNYDKIIKTIAIDIATGNDIKSKDLFFGSKIPFISKNAIINAVKMGNDILYTKIIQDPNLQLSPQNRVITAGDLKKSGFITGANMAFINPEWTSDSNKPMMNQFINTSKKENITPKSTSRSNIGNALVNVTMPDLNYKSSTTFRQPQPSTPKATRSNEEIMRQRSIAAKMMLISSLRQQYYKPKASPVLRKNRKVALVIKPKPKKESEKQFVYRQPDIAFRIATAMDIVSNSVGGVESFVSLKPNMNIINNSSLTKSTDISATPDFKFNLDGLLYKPKKKGGKR